jgi:flavodoxin I
VLTATNSANINLKGKFMKILIVYDSYFGNTEKVAKAIGAALAASGDVRVVRISDFLPAHLQGIQLLIVGSPTRAFRPSDAIKSFLKGLSARSLREVNTAAFDTRVDITRVNSAILTFLVNIFGYAAQPIARGLQKKGGKLAAAPEGFYVKDKEGPLEDGELERASHWAASLLAK